MDDGIVIRAARAEDVPQIMDIERASYSMPWTETTFRGLIERGDADVLAAEAEGWVVGYAACWVVVDQAEWGNVAVAPDGRRRGGGAVIPGPGAVWPAGVLPLMTAVDHRP